MHATFAALLQASSPPSAAVVQQRIAQHFGVELKQMDAGGWTLIAKHRDHAWAIRPQARAPGESHQYTHSALSPHEVTIAEQSSWTLTIAGRINPDAPLHDLARLLRVLRVAAPDACAIIDPDTQAMHGPQWLDHVVGTQLPPRLDAFYQVHRIHEDGLIWLHTHGLERLGVPELEMLGVSTQNLEQATRLFRAGVAHLVHQGVPAHGEPVQLGRGMVVSFIPWNIAHPYLRHHPGGPADRDDAHECHNLVLVTRGSIEQQRWVSAVQCVQNLKGRLQLYLSAYETHRQEAASRVRWPWLTVLHGVYRDVPQWDFLAKFSFDHPEGREHLWFEIDDMHAHGATGTLLQHTGFRADLSPDTIHELALDQLSAFRVRSPFGTASADDLPLLMQRLRHQASISAD